MLLCVMLRLGVGLVCDSRPFALRIRRDLQKWLKGYCRQNLRQTPQLKSWHKQICDKEITGPDVRLLIEHIGNEA
jgi:hypothetical protein